MQANGQVLRLSGRKKFLAVILTIGFIGQLSTPVLAQGYEAQAPSLDQSQGANFSQDSFLPPEVVPQADAGAGQMTMAATQGQLTEMTPDAHMNLNQTSGVQSAKDMRKAAFDSLLGNTQLSNQMPQYGQQGMGAPGQFAPFNQPGQLPQPQGQYAVGQPDWLTPGVANDNVAPQYGNSSQTQTLTGGSKTPIVRRDTRRGGFSNHLSGGAGLGAGLLATQLRRPGSLFGLGFTGLTMTGFGMRNGFRF
jgi:hypothetical protein